MKLQIKTKNLELDPKIKEHVISKISSLDKKAHALFGPKEKNLLEIKKPRFSFLAELSRETLHHNKGFVFKAKIQVTIVGDVLRSEILSENLKQAVNLAKEEMQMLMVEKKEKYSAISKRRARVAKKEIKMSPAARLYRKGRIRQEGN